MLYFQFKPSDLNTVNWMWNFRRNRSFLAFTNRVGYGIETDGVVFPQGECANYSCGGVNDLYAHGWDPDSIVDEAGHYEVRLSWTTTRTTSGTPRGPIPWRSMWKRNVSRSLWTKEKP